MIKRVNLSIYRFASTYSGRPSSPYEMLGLNPSECSPNVLKKRYYKLAKEFHPDTCKDNEENASERYHDLVAAYNLLRNQKSRNMYDTYQLGWSKDRPAPSLENSVYSHNTTHANYRYWNAGTWEDTQRYQEQAVGGNRYIHMMFMCLVVLCAFHLSNLLDKAEETVKQGIEHHELCERDLIDAYVNFGLGSDKWSRIRRFLWWRVFGNGNQSSDILDKGAKECEALVKDLQEKERVKQAV